MTTFDGKSVLVTGAGTGLGYGMCMAFARAGAAVALNDYDADLATKAAAQINDAVGAQRVTPVPFDVADVAAVRAAVKQMGTLHIAIANAGITDFGAFFDMEPEQFDRIINVNLRGTYFTAQAAAKQMIAQGSGGRIVMMSSVVGLRAFSDLTAYGTTKAGIAHMARMLALVLGSHSITVNAIAPGAILTERTAQETANYAEDWARVNPNRRVGTVDDIVNTVLFLASDGAAHITGQTLTVDGGWTGLSPTPDDYFSDDA
ncbi:MAG: SDR family NAD(P)-dependent oxidoreductase [Chloroflexota bacterium]